VLAVKVYFRWSPSIFVPEHRQLRHVATAPLKAIKVAAEIVATPSAVAHVLRPFYL